MFQKSTMAKHVSTSLHDWAVNEMKYTGPWAEDMAMLCTGPMGSVWEWVINHCRSKEKVKMIKGNLALARRRVGGSSDLSLSIAGKVGGNNSGESGNREELLAEKGKLIGDLHTVLAKIERLRAAVEQHNKDRLELNKSRDDRVKEVKEMQQRTVLLGLYLKQVNNMINKLDDLALKLENLMEHIDEKKVKVGGDKVFSCGSGVESESGKDVREAVHTGVEHFKAMLAGNFNKESRGEAREKIVQLVGELPASVLSDCLIDQTLECTNRIKNKSENVDDIMDANEIRNEDEVYLDSVRKGVGEFYKKHVMSRMTVTNLRSSISLWEEKATLAMDKIGGQGLAELDVGEVEKAKQRAVVASMRSSMECLRSKIAGLGGGGNTQSEKVRIQQEQIENLCQSISALLLKNTVPALKSCQADTLDTMTNTLPVLASQVIGVSKSLTDTPSNHLTILGSCPTSSLTSTLVGSTGCSVLTPVSHLGIKRRMSTLPQIHHRINQKEDTADSLVKLIIEVDRRERELAHSLQEEGRSEDIDELNRLEQILITSIREQGRNLGPLIEEGELKRLEASKTSTSIQTIHNEWSCQPGGEVAVGDSLMWREVEGRKLQQWVDLVRINLAKLYSNNNG